MAAAGAADEERGRPPALPVEAAAGAGAGADGPSAEGASERASRASRRRHGPERPDGHGRGLRRPGAACGLGRPLPRASRPEPPPPAPLGPLSWIPPGPPPGPPAPPGPGPETPAAPRAGPRPAGPPRGLGRALTPDATGGIAPPPPSRALPPGLAARPGRGHPQTRPKPGLRAQPALAPPPTRALGVFPGPCFGAQLGGPVLPSPARAILEAEGCQRLPPRLRRRGPRPRGAWGASSAFYTVGWSLHAFPFTGRSSGAGWGADPERGLVRPEAWGPPRGKGAPWYAPCCRKPQYLFSLSQMCWVPGVPLTLPCVFLPCLDSALRLK